MMTLSDLLARVEDFFDRSEDPCCFCGSYEHTERVVSCGAYVPCSVVVCPETGESNIYP